MHHHSSEHRVHQQYRGQRVRTVDLVPTATVATVTEATATVATVTAATVTAATVMEATATVATVMEATATVATVMEALGHICSKCSSPWGR
jgi:hypothetical protein